MSRVRESHAEKITNKENYVAEVMKDITRKSIFLYSLGFGKERNHILTHFFFINILYN